MLKRAGQGQMAVVTRRQLTAALGVVAASPLAGRAQRAAMPVIGFLNSSSKAVFLNDRLLAFHRGLNEAGFVEGRNVAIEFRFADGQRDRLRGLADDLVGRNAAAIVVNGVSLSATSTTPIFVGGYDPVAQGLIDSL